jgi:hypothetical protein
MVSDSSFLRWPAAWLRPRFRGSLLAVGALLVGLASLLPRFFAFLQARPGIRLPDPFLAWLPAYDVSGLTFGTIYLGIGAALVYLLPRPARLLRALWAYWLLQVCRLLTLLLVPLAPPLQLRLLHDPLVDRLFYAAPTPITHDLFFSGHTATLFLLACCVPVGWRRYALLAGSALVGLLVLIQHVHYTYDVVAAPFFAGGCYWLACRITRYAGI